MELVHMHNDSPGLFQVLFLGRRVARQLFLSRPHQGLLVVIPSSVHTLSWLHLAFRVTTFHKNMKLIPFSLSADGYTRNTEIDKEIELFQP